MNGAELIIIGGPLAFGVAGLTNPTIPGGHR